LNYRISLLSLLTATLIAGTASAQVGAYTVTGNGGFVGDGNNFVLGSEFTIANPVLVTGLGWWDFGGDGLAIAHPVAIWRVSDQAQLITGTVAAGTGGALIGGFRYTPIVPVLLLPGDYAVAGTSPTTGDNSTTNVAAANFSSDPNVTWVQSREADGTNALVFPTVAGVTSIGIFGASFEFASVPEPSTWALLGITVITAVAFMYYRLRKNSLALDSKLK
jgi:hypothetical protein